MPLFHPFQTCYSVREKARALYTNDISRFYDAISQMTNLKKQKSNMFPYLGQVWAIMEEFEMLMSITTNIEKQQEHRQTLCLVLTLAGLSIDHDSVSDQILASPTIPTVDELFSRLLRLAAPPSHKVVSSPTFDSSALASQTIEKRVYQSMENRRGGGRLGKPRSKCSYCHKSGHTRDICHNLHGPPPSYDPATLKEYNEFLRNRASKHTSSQEAFVAPPDRPSHNAHIAQSEYDEFLQYRASKQTSPQVASVVQHDVAVAGNSFACVSQSNTHGSWVMDSGASDHVSGNKSLMSDIVYSQSLPVITLANGIQTKPKRLEKPHPYLLSL